MSAISPGVPESLPGNIEAIGAGTRRRNPFVATPMWVVMLPISPSAKILWTVLEGHVNEAHHGHRWCYPNQDDIAELSQLSERSIRRHTKELVDAGLIDTKVTWDPAANKKKTFYLVHNEPRESFTGPMSFADFYDERKSRSETNRPSCPDGKEGDPKRPNWPVQSGQSGRFKAANLADKLDQVNKIKGTRSKQTLPFASLTGEDTLFGDDQASSVAAGSKTEKVKSGNDSPEFLAFWDAYPLKKAKGGARVSWAKVLKAGVEPSVLIGAANAYASWARRNPQRLIKHPTTWLNQECWEDELDNIVASNSKGHVPFTQDRNMWADDEGGW